MSAEDGVFDWKLLIESWRTAYGQSFSAVEQAIRADATAETLEFCCADTRPEIEAEVRERIVEQVIWRCADRKHRELVPTPAVWIACAQCVPFIRLVRETK